jgi:hypothetical protein
LTPRAAAALARTQTVKAIAGGSGVVCRWVLAIALVIGLGVVCEAAAGVTTSTGQIGWSGQIDQLAMQINFLNGDLCPRLTNVVRWLCDLDQPAWMRSSTSRR